METCWEVTYKGITLAVLQHAEDVRDFVDHAAFRLNLLVDNGIRLEWADPIDRVVVVREIKLTTVQEAETNLENYVQNQADFWRSNRFREYNKP